MSDFLTDEEMAALEKKMKQGAPVNPLQEALTTPIAHAVTPMSSETVGPTVSQDFIPDDVMGDGDGSWESGAADLLRETGHGLGKVVNTVDQYTVAPIRAGIGSLVGIETKPEPNTDMSRMFPPLALGERYGANAPSSKQIMAKLGVSEEEYPIDLYKNPFTREKYTVSPAGMAGGALDTVIDPTMYFGGVGLEKGMIKGADSVLGAGERLGDFAAEKVIKAGMGENKAGLLRAGKTKRGKVTPAAVDEIRRKGKMLFEKDPNFGGEKAVGWFDKSEDLARKAEERRKYYGEEIGKVGPIVDRLAPETMMPQALAGDVDEMRKGVSIYGKGKTARKRLAEEADNLRFGMAEDEVGPPGPMPFKKMQDMRTEAYPYTHGSGDVLQGDRDINTSINNLIGRRLDTGAKTAASRTGDASELKTLSGYAPARDRYGLYKDIAQAGSEQELNRQNRRAISPSTYMTAAGVAAGGGGPAAIPAAIAHQIALSRGAAFSANAANAISKKILKGGAIFEKWRPIMTTAAQGGYASVLAAHHQLMNNDPEYRALMFQSEEP